MSATLTAARNSGTTYTTLPVTAMPVSAPSGETIFVGVGLATVEAYVASAPIAQGDTTINVVSHLAAHTNPIGAVVDPRYTLSAIGRTLSEVQTPRLKRV